MSSLQEGSPGANDPLTDATEAAIQFERVARSVARPSTPGSEPPLNWAVLRAIAEVPPGSAYVAQVARRLGLSHAPVSRAVSALRTRGDLAHARGAGRGRQLELTDAGRQRLRDDPIAATVDILRRVDPADLAAFSRTLQMLAARLESRI